MTHKQNLHTHTTYVDGKDTPEELILRAIELGFDSIGFSEHSYLSYSSFPNQLTAEKMDLYRNEILSLKQTYAHTLDVFCGLEYDFYSDLDTTGLDYLIGSVHYLQCGDEIKTFDMGLKETLDYINRYFDGDAYAYAEEYFRLVGDIVEKTNADLIGHFDLLTKFCDRGLAFDPENPRYVAAWKAAADKLLQTGVPFEINTGAISRGYRKTPYPALDIMRYLAEHGGKAVITSDSHTTEGLGCAYELAYTLAKEAGLHLVGRVGNIEF